MALSEYRKLKSLIFSTVVMISLEELRFQRDFKKLEETSKS